MRTEILLRLSFGIAALCTFAVDRLPAGTQPGAFQISATDDPESRPKIDGRYVVWTDVQAFNNDAYAYDLTLNQRIILSDESRNQDTPSVSGNVAVWDDWSSGSPNKALFGRVLDGVSGTFTVSSSTKSESGQQISGNLVVWHDNRNGKFQIWGRKLDQPLGSDFAISTTTATFDQIDPDVSGDVAVWMSFNEGGSHSHVYVRDIRDTSIAPITTNSADQYNPRISGREVVWVDPRDGGLRVYGKNLDSGAEMPISSGIATQSEPAIDGDLVVWRDDRSGVSDIWGRYLSGGPEFQITNTPDIYETNPDVSGNVVVWEQSTDGANTDIYGIVVPEPATGSFIIVALTSSLLRRPRWRRCNAGS